MDVELAGKTLSSGVIQNMQKNSNFEDVVLYMDVVS